MKLDFFFFFSAPVLPFRERSKSGFLSPREKWMYFQDYLHTSLIIRFSKDLLQKFYAGAPKGEVREKGKGKREGGGIQKFAASDRSAIPVPEHFFLAFIL